MEKYDNYNKAAAAKTTAATRPMLPFWEVPKPLNGTEEAEVPVAEVVRLALGVVLTVAMVAVALMDDKATVADVVMTVSMVVEDSAAEEEDSTVDTATVDEVTSAVVVTAATALADDSIAEAEVDAAATTKEDAAWAQIS